VELADLSRRMAEGEDRAWREFHDTYGAALFRMLLALTYGDPHLASDALQHAYVRVSRHVRVCSNEAMWMGWLRIVARSALSDARRKEGRFWNMLRRHNADPSDQPECAGATSTDENGLLSALDSALASLDPDKRALLEAKYLRGQSVEAIAGAAGLTAKAVESRLTRARTELRERVQGLVSRTAHE
jgi:RNA polymerase sigma factor (sigma-70 family)